MGTPHDTQQICDVCHRWTKGTSRIGVKGLHVIMCPRCHALSDLVSSYLGTEPRYIYGLFTHDHVDFIQKIAELWKPDSSLLTVHEANYGAGEDICRSA